MIDFNDFIEKNKDRIICYPSEKTYQELMEDKEKIMLSSKDHLPVNEETKEDIERKVDELLSVMKNEEKK